MFESPDAYEYLITLAQAGDARFWQGIINQMRGLAGVLDIAIQLLEQDRHPEKDELLKLRVSVPCAVDTRDGIYSTIRALMWALPHLSEDTKQATLAFMRSGSPRLSLEDIAAVYRRAYDEVLAKLAGLQTTQPSETPGENDNPLMRLVRFFAPGGGAVATALEILAGPRTVNEKLHALCDLSDAFAERLMNADLREIAGLLGCSHEAVRQSDWYKTEVIAKRMAERDKYREKAPRRDIPRTEG